MVRGIYPNPLRKRFNNGKQPKVLNKKDHQCGCYQRRVKNNLSFPNLKLPNHRTFNTRSDMINDSEISQ